MCGICGIVGSAERAHLDAMIARIAHRGPDDRGVYESERGPDGSRVLLGHLRLAIIDLSPGGHQPMPDASGRYWLTYNGEIYNYRSIREELQSCGYRFSSESDTEVIVSAYAEWGPECLTRFNGMFALAIWDTQERTLFAARDRLGIKPFYWTLLPEGFAFASEVKAFLDLPGFNAELDPEALHQYLTFLWVPDPKTAFRGVSKLRPGHYLIYHEGDAEPQIEEFWDAPFAIDRATTEPEWRERILDQLGKAVDRRLIADVPLGAFLSGGVDSSLIVGLMTERMDRAVQTYTIGFRERGPPPRHPGGRRRVRAHRRGPLRDRRLRTHPPTGRHGPAPESRLLDGRARLPIRRS